jgi:hypothetical protein
MPSMIEWSISNRPDSSFDSHTTPGKPYYTLFRPAGPLNTSYWFRELIVWV